MNWSAVINTLIDETKAANERAVPGTNNFQHEMVVSRVLFGLARALQEGLRSTENTDDA